VNIRLLLLLLF